MTKPNKRNVALLALLLVLLLLLSSCARSMEFVKSGVYRLNGVTYHIAPSCYEPRAYLASGKVAKLERKNMEDMILYEVEGCKDRLWLCDKELSVLFYAEGQKLPTLKEMNPTSISLQLSDVVSLGMGAVEDPAEISRVVESVANGPSFLLSDLTENIARDRYDVKFSSPAYPAFYYSLVYYRFASEVILYEAVENPDDFTPSYSGVEVTVEDHDYNEVVDGSMVSRVEHLAVYHFGRDILYDVESGRCYMAGTEAFAAIVDAQPSADQ